MEREVIYHESCAYDLGDDDQADWLKTFGFTIGFDFDNSVRFGNRHDAENELQEIGYFIHENGVKKYGFICRTLLEKPILQRLVKINNKGFVTAIFIVIYHSGRRIELTKDTQIPYRWYGIKLYPFFGGNRFAPHNFYITLNNLFMRKTLDSIKKHWFFSLGFLLIIPVILAWTVYAERDQWPAIYYWCILIPILIYIFIILPLLRRAENKNL